jgi:hypothetical protein
MNIQQFAEDASFSYEKNLLKKLPKDWTINEMWVYHLQALLTALDRNEDYLPATNIDSPPNFAMKTNVWIFTCKTLLLSFLLPLPLRLDHILRHPIQNTGSLVVMLASLHRYI